MAKRSVTERDQFWLDHEAALAGSGLPGSQVELELTESMLVVGGADIEAILARLKALGVRLTLDDFGTGYSSLAYLRRFQIDCLKIDQSFVRNVADHPADETIARTIVSLARMEMLLRIWDLLGGSIGSLPGTISENSTSPSRRILSPS